MKRCPQCQFMYEDDQSLCDMDGILLVFDAEQLPKLTESGPTRPKPHWRGRVVPALAALVLTIVLCLVYIVSTHQRPSARTYSPASSAAQPGSSSNVAPTSELPTTPVDTTPKESNANVAGSDAKVSKEETRKEKPKPASNPKAAADSNEKPKAKATQKPTSSVQATKEDSKIGSLLKKTGRILKKPFKF